MMFDLYDEEAPLKTIPVRPNDVMNIRAPKFRNTLQAQGKKVIHFQKVKKISTLKTDAIENQISKQSLPQTKKVNSMSRGDPFLPSVISDESPLVDYPVKNSRKKPTDCKCKGSGYNLSPSALLPEEMRQQWGVGDFGRPSVPSFSNSISTATQPLTYSLSLCRPRSNGDSQNIKLMNYERNDQKHFPIPISSSAPILSSFVSNKSSSESAYCQICFQSSCTCHDHHHQGFRLPVKNDGRRLKTSLKSQVVKNKENLIASNMSSGMKKLPCYDCKENNNIISTSNFHKSSSSTSSMSSLSQERSYASPSYDAGYFNAVMSGSQKPSHVNNSQTYDPGEFSDMTKDTLTPKVRHHHMKRSARRSFPEMMTPSVISSDQNIHSNVPVYERNRILPRTNSQSQMLSMGDRPQFCSCESCRPIRSFISQGDSSNYTQNHTQTIGSSIPMQSATPMQHYKSPSMPVQQKRYHPYVTNPLTNPYTYSNNSRPVYQSSDLFACNSPEFDYETQNFPQTSSMPISIPKDISALEASLSYLDNDSFSSPANSPGEVKDILDLSVKETVDFFVSMKSPFTCSEPLAETFNDNLPSSSYSLPFLMSDNTLSPPQQMSNFSNCVPSSQGTPSREVYSKQHIKMPQYPMHLQPVFPRTNSSRPQPNYSMSRSKPLPAQSMSLLYSLEVSDLEDELRSAIENIPTD